jgi:hypothetical protein
MCGYICQSCSGGWSWFRVMLLLQRPGRMPYMPWVQACADPGGHSNSSAPTHLCVVCSARLRT